MSATAEPVAASTSNANHISGEGDLPNALSQPDEQAEQSTPMICFRCRYSNFKHSVRLPSSETVGDLKALLYSLTDVPFERQKILGLTKGKLPSDDTLLGSLTFAPTSYKSKTSDGQDEVTVQLVGTPLSLSFKDLEGANNELENVGGQEAIYSVPDTELISYSGHDRRRSFRYRLLCSSI